MNLMINNGNPERQVVSQGSVQKYTPRRRQTNSARQAPPYIDHSNLQHSTNDINPNDNNSPAQQYSNTQQTTALPQVGPNNISAKNRQNAQQNPGVQENAVPVGTGQSMSQTTLLQSTVSQQMLADYYNSEMDLLNQKVECLQLKLNQANEQTTFQQNQFEQQLNDWNKFYENKQKSLQQQINELDKQLKSVQAEKTKLQDQKNKQSKEYQQYKQDMEEIQKSKDQYQEFLKTHQLQIASLQEQNTMLQKQLTIQNDQIQQLQTEREQFKQKIGQYADVQNMLLERKAKSTQTELIEQITVNIQTESQELHIKSTQTEENPMYEDSQSSDAEVEKIVQRVQQQEEFNEQLIKKQQDEYNKHIEEEQMKKMEEQRRLKELHDREKEHQQHQVEQLNLQQQQVQLIEQLQKKQEELNQQLQQLNLSHQQFAQETRSRLQQDESEEHTEPEVEVSHTQMQNGKPEQHIQTQEQKQVPNGTSKEVADIVTEMNKVSSMFTGEQSRLMDVKVDVAYQKLSTLNYDDSQSKKESNNNTDNDNQQQQPTNAEIALSTVAQSLTHNEQPQNQVSSLLQQIQNNQKQHQTNQHDELQHNEHHNEASDNKSDDQEGKYNQIHPAEPQEQNVVEHKQAVNEPQVSHQANVHNDKPHEETQVVNEEKRDQQQYELDQKQPNEADNQEQPPVTEPLTTNPPDEAQQEAARTYSPAFRSRMEKIITQLLETGETDEQLSQRELEYLREQGYDLDGSECVDTGSQPTSPAQPAAKDPKYSPSFCKRMDAVIAQLLETGEMEGELTPLEIQYIHDQGYDIEM